MKINSTAVIFFLALVGLDAHASLKLNEVETTSGTGLGSVNTVLTVQRDPQDQDPESGCVAWDGSVDIIGSAACPAGSGIAGGDEQTGASQTQTRTLSELGIQSAFNLRVVFNFQDPDPATNVELEDLILTIFDTDGSVCFSSGPFSPVTFQDAASGTGNAGFVFRLDAKQAGQAQGCFSSSDRRVGLATQASGVSEGGLETFFVADASDVTDPAADMAIEKGDSADPVPVNSSLTYTLTVTNNGPNNADGVEISDSLPPSVTFDSATPDQGSCSESGGFVACQLGQLASGNSTMIDITVTTGGSDQTITNTASVVSSLPDPDTSNNTATEQTVVGLEAPERADLSIVKDDAPDPVVVGNTLTYTLNVSNGGPDTAIAVVVNDTLPDSLTGISATTTTGTCSVSGQTVTCDLGGMAPGAGETISIDATPTETGTIQNTGTVGSDTNDPDNTNNSDTQQTTVEAEPAPSADLRLMKIDEVDPVALGAVVEYTLTVNNDGPDTAVSVLVTDQAPDQLGDLSPSTADGTCSVSGKTITCQLGDIASGASEQITITGTAPEANTTLTNSATVDSDTPDGNASNNDATEQTTVGGGSSASADVSITKNDSPDPLQVGDRLTYTLQVRNAGPDPAASVIVSDSLPASACNPAVTASAGSCTIDSQTVRCDLGNLAAQTSETVTIEVTPTERGELQNIAQVGTETSDPNPDNNSDSEQTTVTAPEADIAVSKNDSRDPVEVGQGFTYTLTASNLGPDTATDVEVSDTVPTEMTIDSVSTDPGSCTFAANAVTCSLGELAPDATVSIEVAVTAQEAGTFLNTASIGAEQPDPDPNDNSVSEETTVEATLGPVADLALSKVDAVDPVAQGATVEYTLTVVNNGPDTAVAVRVNDQAPDRLGSPAANTPDGTCSVSGQTIACEMGDIASGASEQITVTGTAPAADTTITNSATVDSDSTDDDTSNNSASEQTTVGIGTSDSADVSVTKNDDSDPVTVGERLTYTVQVQNAGPDPAASVVVSDSLPISVADPSVSTTAGSCSTSGQTVECDLGNMADGASETITIAVTPTESGTLKNTAQAATETADPDPDNNSGREQTRVVVAEQVLPIPVLSWQGLVLLILSLLAGSVYALRRPA